MRHLLACSILGLAACGHAPAATARYDFDCRDRKAAYFVVGSMSGQESGVQLDCNVRGPRITRYTEDNSGTRVEDSAAVSPGEFDDVWVRINGTGWRHLGDCAGDAGEDVPVYTYDVADDTDSETFECDALDPPFPYNTLVDELDQLAGAIPAQRGAGGDDDDGPE